MKFFRKIILIVSLAIAFCFWQTPKTQAAWVPGIDPIIRTGLETIKDMILDLVVGTLKQQAVRSLNSQIDKLAGQGAGGQSTFITNWADYLVTQPINKTNVYMNDYLSKMTRGRNTYSGYSTQGHSGQTNYSANLANSVTTLKEDDVPETNYEGDPSQMFDNRNFKNMNLYLSGVNNPWAFNIAYEEKQQEHLANEKEKAQIQGVAYQGFRPTPGSSPESVANPGILTKEMTANVQNMPNNVLASAKSIPEVISAIVAQMINRSITQGFKSVQRKISKKTSSINQATSSIDKAINDLGPEARFDN